MLHEGIARFSAKGSCKKPLGDKGLKIIHAARFLMK
jgi:hypothetical protein